MISRLDSSIFPVIDAVGCEMEAHLADGGLADLEPDESGRATFYVVVFL